MFCRLYGNGMPSGDMSGVMVFYCKFGLHQNKDLLILTNYKLSTTIVIKQ